MRNLEKIKKEIQKKHKELDMTHSFCPVCYDEGFKEGLKRNRRKRLRKLFTVCK